MSLALAIQFQHRAATFTRPMTKRKLRVYREWSGTQGSKLIGFTVERSTIGVLRFEVSTAAELSEGDVAFARVSGRDVFYQILDAETSGVV